MVWIGFHLLGDDRRAYCRSGDTVAAFVNIALISYEYPPSVAIGGIGTYVWNASHMLAGSGAHVIVFSAGHEDGIENPHPHIEVRRVAVKDRAAFPQAIVPHLLSAHARRAFDIIEAPEIGPEGGPAFAALPTVARVVKLHTASFLVGRFGYSPPSQLQRLRFLAGALRRGRWATLRPPPAYVRENDAEYRAALLADEIAAPSQAIGDILQREWSLDQERISVYPYPYTPSPALLALPLPACVQTVGFLGRLEARKGVAELVKAIPAILARAPGLRFNFIGPSWPHAGTDMQTWILRHHPRLAHALEFTGAVTPARVPDELSRCDALVLPSRWESFGYTCVEAMISGRAVIGSAAGGMAEIIEPGISGLLVPPRSPQAITDAVLYLIDHADQVAALGAGGRGRIATLLAPQHILPLQLASYRRAMQRAAARNTRT